MADRSAASAFGAFFSGAAKKGKLSSAQRAAVDSLYRLTSGYDFSRYQMGVEPSLAKLGIIGKDEIEKGYEENYGPRSVFVGITWLRTLVKRSLIEGDDYSARRLESATNRAAAAFGIGDTPITKKTAASFGIKTTSVDAPRRSRRETEERSPYPEVGVATPEFGIESISPLGWILIIGTGILVIAQVAQLASQTSTTNTP
jgi:hypothetical protein